MTNLSSLSKAKASLLAAGLLAVAFLLYRALSQTPAPFVEVAIEQSMLIVLIGISAWFMRDASRAVREAASVCRLARDGNLEARILTRQGGGELGDLQASTNDLLDIVDAFVRETAASMESASRGKFFRKILVKGLPGSFRTAAIIINEGIYVVDRRVIDLARLAESFGGTMDGIAGPLTEAARVAPAPEGHQDSPMTIRSGPL
jgi:methyl-accepting chemotaxis protein